MNTFVKGWKKELEPAIGKLLERYGFEINNEDQCLINISKEMLVCTEESRVYKKLFNEGWKLKNYIPLTLEEFFIKADFIKKYHYIRLRPRFHRWNLIAFNLSGQSTEEFGYPIKGFGYPKFFFYIALKVLKNPKVWMSNEIIAPLMLKDENLVALILYGVF